MKKGPHEEHLASHEPGKGSIALNDTYPYVNLPLPYAYGALAPYIDAETMELHHDRHLQTYIDNLNRALEAYPAAQKLTLEQLLHGADRLPAALRTPVRNNAGGVYNHRFFFDGLSPNGPTEPVGELASALYESFGGYGKFKAAFKAAGLGVFGSGYVWLLSAPDGSLSITATPNQDVPPPGFCPVLTLDVWEHAYYLKHYNVRGAYIDDFFHIVHWSRANERYVHCQLR